MSQHTLIVDQSGEKPVSYGRILEFQREWAKAVSLKKLPNLVWIGNHPPVVTLGRHANESELFVSQDELTKLGVELHPIERGGLATVHGPGQLVSYPIVNVTDLGIGVRDFVSSLEQTMIDTLSRIGISAGRDERGPGIWVDDDKIGFIGLALKRRVSYHGLSLNVVLDPKLFELISPCGLKGVAITSVENILGRKIELELTGKYLAESLAKILDLEYLSISLEEAEEKLKGVAS